MQEQLPREAGSEPPGMLRAAHPCALSRSTVHPEHNGVSQRALPVASRMFGIELKESNRGFTGSRVLCLRHAVNTSM